MRRNLFLKAAFVSATTLFTAITAVAGSFGPGCGSSPMGCQAPVEIMNQPSASIDPITVQNNEPMGYLRSVDYSGSPHISITRVYSQNDVVGLEDAPTGITGGCNPHSTGYCGAQVSNALPPAAPIAMPYTASQPVFGQQSMPMMAPTMPGAVYGHSNIVQKRGHIVAVRADGTYWENVSGQTLMHAPQAMVQAPMALPMQHITMPQPTMSHAPIAQPYSPVQNDGTYWEKVSGPIVIGGMQATQVICKRQAKVVRPVVPVPTPVPTPVPMPVGCAPAMAGPAVPHMSMPFAGSMGGRYGH